MPVDVIEDALTLLCARYVFPEKAAAAAKANRTRRVGGAGQHLDRRVRQQAGQDRSQRQPQ